MPQKSVVFQSQSPHWTTVCSQQQVQKGIGKNFPASHCKGWSATPHANSGSAMYGQPCSNSRGLHPQPHHWNSILDNERNHGLGHQWWKPPLFVYVWETSLHLHVEQLVLSSRGTTELQHSHGTSCGQGLSFDTNSKTSWGWPAWRQCLCTQLNAPRDHTGPGT